MFIVLLKFSETRARAGDFMTANNEWLQHGFDDGMFLMAGSLQPQMGGGILAHNASRAELETRENSDPFVVEGVVRAEILEITPVRADEQLQFLLD